MGGWPFFRKWAPHLKCQSRGRKIIRVWVVEGGGSWGLGVSYRSPMPETSTPRWLAAPLPNRQYRLGAPPHTHYKPTPPPISPPSPARHIQNITAMHIPELASTPCLPAGWWEGVDIVARTFVLGWVNVFPMLDTCTRCCLACVRQSRRRRRNFCWGSILNRNLLKISMHKASTSMERISQYDTRFRAGSVRLCPT